MADKDQLVRRTLSLIGAGQAGQAPPPEDEATLSAAIPSLLDDLARRNVVYVADVDDFDDAYLQWLAVLLANYVASDFGFDMAEERVLQAEARLRQIQAQPYARSPARPAYF